MFRFRSLPPFLSRSVSVSVSPSLSHRLSLLPLSSFGLARVSKLFSMAEYQYQNENENNSNPSIAAVPLLIHVGGSNGKGSVCTKLSNAFSSLGLTVGLYTSPHISSIRERIRVNGRPIDAEQFEAETEKLLALDRLHQINASLFELTTVAALIHFRRRHCAVGLIEVGMGGRCDATNFITPALSVITSIGLEHTQYLGSSVELIAREKGGIIKPGIPVLVGPNVPLAPIREISSALNSPLHVISAADSGSDSDSGSLIDCELENEAIARAALKIFSSTESGISLFNSRRISLNFADPLLSAALKSRAECRQQLFAVDIESGESDEITDEAALQFPLSSARRLVLLDVSHNPPALARLFSSIRHKFPTKPIRTIFSASSDKLLSEMIATLAASSASVHFLSTPSARSFAVADVLALVDNQLIKEKFSNCKLHFHQTEEQSTNTAAHQHRQRQSQNQNPYQNSIVSPSVQSKLIGELIRSSPSECLTVICGTFHLMKHAIEAIGGKSESADPIDLNESSLKHLTRR